MADDVEETKELVWSKAAPERWSKWLLDFARKDLNAYTREDWRTLGQEIREFLLASSFFDVSKHWEGNPNWPKPGFGARIRKGMPKELKDDESLRGIQRQLQVGINKLVPKDLADPQHVGVWRFPAFEVDMGLISSIAVKRLKGKSSNRFDTHKVFTHVHRSLRADWPSIFWLAVTEVLEETGTCLRRCKSCKKLYLKRKRQAYCSKQCSQAVRTKRFRTLHPDKAKEHRHTAYENKMRKAIPGFPNIKSGRNRN